MPVSMYTPESPSSKAPAAKESKVPASKSFTNNSPHKQPLHKINAKYYFGGKKRGDSVIDAPKRGPGRPRKYPRPDEDREGKFPNAPKASSEKNKDDAPKRKSGRPPQHPRPVDDEETGRIVRSKIFEDYFVAYNRKLPSDTIESGPLGDYIGFFDGKYIYNRTERTCVKMLVAEQQRQEKLGLDGGKVVCKVVVGNVTLVLDDLAQGKVRVVYNEAKEVATKRKECAPGLGLDFDQMREAWADDEKLFDCPSPYLYSSVQ